MALLLTGGVIGLYFQPPGVRKVMGWLALSPGGGTSNPIAIPAPPRNPDAGKPAPRAVLGLGKLMPEGEVITIARLMALAMPGWPACWSMKATGSPRASARRARQ